LDYHRDWHEGLVHPSVPIAKLSPIELFDAYLQITGRLDVPQHPRLIYQFLPTRWATIRHDGVEIKNLTYDDPILDGFRTSPVGRFRAQDAAAPFFYDPRDVSRVWFPHPTTGQVHPINWRGAWRTQAPMTDKVRDLILERLRDRGGNAALTKTSATEQILHELTDLSAAGVPKADQALWSAAAVRVDSSRRDHLEAQLAAYSAHRRRTHGEDDRREDHEEIAATTAVGGDHPVVNEGAPVAALWAHLRDSAAVMPDPPRERPDAADDAAITAVALETGASASWRW
jgi:hypothetical protein